MGRPVSNTQAYVLGEQGELLPFGVTGELYLGGAGVACGYLNQPQLTAQRFIPDRFSNNTDARLYRTGDLVRYDQQGELCFIGRVDEQVKLRGFRIELGEIEHHLNSHDAVIESLVLVVEEAGESQLQAYVRTEEATGLAQQLREYLRALLPEYMLPSRYIAVSQWPLSPNGKIDKNALKQLHSNTELEAFIAPRNATEEQLLLIWQRLLKNDAIGINDHFFTVGGDSIIAIQLVAMAREVGLHITLKEVMQLPTVADQALVVKASKEVSAEQSPLSGEFRPLPIQLRFLQRSKGAAVHHYNQSILLQVPIELSQDFLRQAVSCLLDRHDALRLRFTHKSTGWMGEFIALEQIDINRVVQNVFVADWSAEAVTEIAAAAQSGFNISKGELFKAVLISGKSEARLLLVAHHLVVDGVSWRILVQDLQRLWCQHQRQEIPRLPAKTSSIRQWSDTLALHYDDFQAQQVFWLAQLAAENTMMPLSESEIEPCLRSESEIVKLQLTHSVTRQLLGSANQAYRTQVEDLLLSGLYLALQQTFAVSQVAVALESHGRDPISDDVDLSETVGWFTSLYPLLLSSEGTGLTEVIIAVKERRRVISESNVGFGTLKYYSQTSECSHFEQADPFVLFNYLGQIEINAEHEHGDFSLANESMGSNLHEQALREFAIAINGQVSEGLLHLMIDYSVAQFSPETMVALKNNLAMALQDIANHCEGRMPMLTTSDVPHVELQQSQLNEWQKRFGTLINIFPATPLQHGIFFQSQIDKKAYLTQVVNQISGELNIKAMELAWQYVTNRHEILRSGFAIEKSSLYRFVLAPDIKVPVRFLDWSDLSDEQRHSAFITLREQDREMAMPLNEAPLHRVTIVRYGSMQHQLLWTHHHLILDGWCLQTVYQELLQSYLSFANSQPLSLPKPIPLDGYYDWLQSKDKQSALDYWHTYLHDFDSPTALLESQNLDVQSGYVERQWQISTSLSQKLRVLASEAKVTLNAVIQWAWGYLLQRYSGDQKVLFGTVISGRPSEVQNIEKMVGLFINTIPVKVDFVPSTDLKAQLKQLHESQLQSQEHGFLTLPEIQQQTAIAAEIELFDSIVVFENYPTESNSSVANNTSDVVINSSETAEYSAVPLTFIVNDNEHLQLTLGYRKERFSDNTIAQMQHHLDAIFSQLADGRGVGEISLLSTSEQHLLAQQHDTFCSHNLALLPHQYVDHFAQVTPNSIAVLDTQETLTYQQLNQAANRLARLLQAQGVMQESFVALYLERHCSMVIAILAVLKAGGAYVPIDPSMPDARSSAILDQLGDVQVLTQQHLAEAECLQSHQVTVIDSEATLDTLFQYRATTPSTFELSATNLAYMIFTSGTTGQPKGVMVEHQALLNRVLWMQKQYGLKASDKVLQKTPYGFDVSVWEFVWPWTVGASIVLAKPEGHKEPKYLAELIQRQGITHCHFVPSMLQAFMQHAELSQCQTLKQVFCSGEALTRDHREQFIRASSAQLHNLYGPTEAAIDVSYWDCSKTTSAPSVPIGYAIDNINCVVVSPDFAEQPIGIPGELLISGIGLARGYFQQEQLTAEKFITVSLANRSQQRYYRTGDLVRRLECGALEFLGRLDHQVKIRGLRVELGEIQAAIAGCDEVEEAFVSVQELQAGEQLIAFCVTSLDSAELSAVIPKLLASTLPNYMIPATYIALTELPVTVNGKLDRKALYSMVTAQPQIEYVPAHTATEVALEEVWRECLGITEPLSTVQSFFALGGNSLHAMSILDRVQSHWDYPFEIADLFAFQTIKELAQFIDATQSQYSSEQQELEADSEAFEEMEF
ncbi:amino acid adenylation domain-containing protein [Pseudoalteromonas sp. JC3]|uniref:amino acid adenylation domain-containing protein n=1 Tax=Pseudoalteromonas sp. JC3 TaxID=2810196 RepID=UPI0032BF9259